MKKLATSLIVFLAFAALASCAVSVAGDGLEAGFRNPPAEAGIRCFWWWLNSNVTKEAITRDLEEMKAKGFSGALIFDADGSGQRGNRRVPAGPVFASPEWTELFVHACREAKRLGLELSLNLQSGWNLGGPNVTAEEATQHLVWSKTTLQGPATVEQPLPVPRHRDFYRDVVVLAVPTPNPSHEKAAKGKRVACELEASSSQSNHPARAAMDGSVDTFWVSQDPPTADNPQWLLLTLSEPVKLSQLTLRGRDGYGPRAGKVEVAADGTPFHQVGQFTLNSGETLKARFDEQPVKRIRLTFTDAYDPNPAGGKARNVQVAEISLPGIGPRARPDELRLRPIEQLHLKSATRELGMSAPDCRFLLETSPTRPGELAIRAEDIVNISAKMDASGTLRWEVPVGEWVVLRIGHAATGAHVSTHSAGWGGRVLDYMNPDALHAYWGRNIAPLIEAIGPMAGTTLRYVHTDSWEGGGMNWTPGFDQAFRENRGYDPLPWLAVLAGYVVDSREESNAFLADFRKTIGDRVADHYELLAELADRHGMGTHPECSGPHAGPLDGLKNYGRSELMMSEFWSPSPHRPRPDSRFFVKQASSAAHTYGQRLVGAEGFTTIGPHWNDIPWAHMKPSFDTEFCAGLNLLFVHTTTCSPPEMGLPGQEYFAGTHFNPQVTWWDEAPAVIDYFKRCQYLAQQGRFVADVVHYYGDHIPNVFGRKGHDPAGALPEYDYDVLSEELLLSALAVKDGRLTLPSGMEYRVLTLPDHRVLSLDALEKIDSLVRDGATVLGSKPTKLVSLTGGQAGKRRFHQLADGLWGGDDAAASANGTRTVGKGRVAWGMTARELLLADGVAPDAAITLADGSIAPDVDWIHYRIGDVDVYFVAELAGKEKNVDVVFRVNGRIPELWDAADGSIRDAATFSIAKSRTRVPLMLKPYDSLFLVFRKPTSDAERNGDCNWPLWSEVQPIVGPWRVRFDPNFGGPKEPVQFQTLIDWREYADPGIKHYSGKAVYQTTFKLNDLPDGTTLSLALGDVRDVGIARVRLNDADLGVVWRPPFRVDVSKAIRQGENELEVTVVNSWRNRLIGDQQLPPEQRRTRTNIRVRNWKLEPSGLLGPVRLVAERR